MEEALCPLYKCSEPPSAIELYGDEDDESLSYSDTIDEHEQCPSEEYTVDP